MYNDEKNALSARVAELEEQFNIFKRDYEDSINNIDSGMLDEHLSKRLTVMEQGIKDLGARVSALEGD